MAGSFVIVGGGVIGCSIAYHLAGLGQRVTLLERAEIAGEASGAAAGLLAPVAESSEDDPFLRLATAGLRVFEEDAASIEAVSGLSIEYAPTGIVRTAGSLDEADALQQRIPWATAQGLPVRWYDALSVRALVPVLGDGVVGGLYSPEEGHVHPARLTQALAQGAARRGAEICEGADVDALVRSGDAVAGVRLRDGETVAADCTVLAGGAWTRFAARGALDVPVVPVHGQYAILRMLPQPFTHALYGEHIYLLPRPDGTIYAGATEEPENGYRKRVTAGGVRWLLDGATALVPVLDAAEVVRTGAGLRPSTADKYPVLGLAPGIGGLAVASGHYRNGVLLSLITGRLLGELLVYGRTSMDLAPFSPGRFALRDRADGSGAGSREA